MAVMITEACIACNACEPECPVGAILDESNEKNPYDVKYYVRAENCVECVGHADAPRCAQACPTEGAIVWDMPYTVAFNEYYKNGNNEGIYKIREHKKKGLMLPEVKSQNFIAAISMEMRTARENVSDFS